MKRLIIPMLLLALAALQLVRIERVAAQQSDSASTAPASEPVVDGAGARVIPTASAKFRREEYETAVKRPYVIEPPDVLSITVERDSAASDKADQPRSFRRQNYLVHMDGKIDLGVHGRLYVAGMTIDQARAAVEKRLAKRLDSPQAFVDVHAANSKVYYTITKGAGDGDDVTRQPITGNETVIDAVAVIGGAAKDASTRMWIARPAPMGVGAEQILPVNWDDMASGASMATNHQLLPGDRLFVNPPRKVEAAAAAPSDDTTAPAAPPTPAVPAPITAAEALSTAEPPAPDQLRVGQRQVLFDIRVIEDAQNSMAEFEPLREHGFMLADSSTTLGALRILEKHQLVKCLAEPRLVTTLGRPAQISVGELTPEADDGENLRHGTHVKVSAEQDKDRLLVQWLVRISDNGAHLEGSSKTAMSKGQTAVYKMGPPSKRRGKPAPPIYVVVTPTLIK